MREFRYTKVKFFNENKSKEIKKSFFIGFLFFLLTIISLSSAYIAEGMGSESCSPMVNVALISLSVSIVVFLAIDVRRH